MAISPGDLGWSKVALKLLHVLSASTRLYKPIKTAQKLDIGVVIVLKLLGKVHFFVSVFVKGAEDVLRIKT